MLIRPGRRPAIDADFIRVRLSASRQLVIATEWSSSRVRSAPVSRNSSRVGTGRRRIATVTVLPRRSPRPPGSRLATPTSRDRCSRRRWLRRSLVIAVSSSRPPSNDAYATSSAIAPSSSPDRDARRSGISPISSPCGRIMVALGDLGSTAREDVPHFRRRSSDRVESECRDTATRWLESL